MTRLRMRVAERLKGAQNTYAMLTTFNEVDMSSLMDMRNSYKDAFFERHGVKLGFMSAFVKAAAVALMEVPAVNAVIDGDEIIYRCVGHQLHLAQLQCQPPVITSLKSVINPQRLCRHLHRGGNPQGPRGSRSAQCRPAELCWH